MLELLTAVLIQVAVLSGTPASKSTAAANAAPPVKTTCIGDDKWGHD